MPAASSTAEFNARDAQVSVLMVSSVPAVLLAQASALCPVTARDSPDASSVPAMLQWTVTVPSQCQQCAKQQLHCRVQYRQVPTGSPNGEFGAEKVQMNNA